jgi:hypothetical protein
MTRCGNGYLQFPLPKTLRLVFSRVKAGRKKEEIMCKCGYRKPKIYSDRCGNCDGRGTIDNFKCEICKGRGWINKTMEKKNDRHCF